MSESGLRKLVRKRAIKFFQRSRGCKIMFKPEWLGQYIEAHTMEAGQPTPRHRRHRTRKNGEALCSQKSHGIEWDLMG